MRDARTVLAESRTIAVVGLSRDPGKAAHRIPARLQSLGWRVLPVHPSADVLLGELVHASLAHITEPIDLVDVFRPAVEAPGIARAAVAAGARALWLQLGISSAEARAIATDGGLDYIEDRCAGADAVAWGLRAPRAQDPGHPR